MGCLISTCRRRDTDERVIFQTNSAFDSSPSNYLNTELRMVLVGKTGVGKSETGNTIIGNEIFKADTSASSVTKTCKQHTFERKGQNIHLIDVPGFIDTKLSEAEIKEEVMRCVALSSPGLHAILFVIEIGRFTEVDIKTLQVFCRCFGEESMKFVIVIFTKLDSLTRKKKTLDEYLREAPGNLTDFLKKTGNRYLAVNNWGEDSEKSTFVKKLLQMVRQLVHANNDTYYTNEMFQKAEEHLKAMDTARVEQLKLQEQERDEQLLKQCREDCQRELDRSNLNHAQKVKKMQAEMERRQQEIDADRTKRAVKMRRDEIAETTGQRLLDMLIDVAKLVINVIKNVFV